MDFGGWSLVLGTFAMVFVTVLGVLTILLPLASARQETRLNCPDCKEFVRK